MHNGSELRVYAVLPLTEFRRLKANEEEIPQPPVEEECEEQGNDEIPQALEMVVLYCPKRSRRNAILLLHYIASMNGLITYDPNTGAIAVKGQVIKHSNLSEIFRILFTNRPGVTEYIPRDTIGMNEFLSALSASAMPSNLIIDKYWINYFSKCRNEQ